MAKYILVPLRGRCSLNGRELRLDRRLSLPEQIKARVNLFEILPGYHSNVLVVLLILGEILLAGWSHRLGNRKLADRRRNLRRRGMRIPFNF